ncbi:MAG: hypothetical protein COA69_05910 [Robiginitomaculum sp.]|nr:MAG: hypothetical protein COA69_05910 [Robiginitomaculum sp.]
MTSPSRTADAHRARAILQTTADELRDLARKTDHIQAIVSQMITEGVDVSDTHIYELQSLDHITQSIDGLADFLCALSTDTPKDWAYTDLKAADCVKLEALAARLAGKVSPASNENNADVDLF